MASDPGMDVLSKLDLTEGGTRVAALAFGITFYSVPPLSKMGKEVLEIFDKFLKLVPAENLKFYSTENMTKHKPANERTLAMLKTWLKPGAPPREYVCVDLKDGAKYNDTPKRKFEVYGTEPSAKDFHKKHASTVSMTFPPEWGWERTDEMLGLVREVADLLPFQSGHAGFVFEVSPYQERIADTHAYATSMRHRGVDIDNTIRNRITVKDDGVRMNWLTLLSPARVEEAGGEKSLRKALPSPVELIPLKKGLMIKAGPRPELGDTNRREFLPAYQAVFAALKPLLEKTAGRTPPLMLSDMDFKERTLKWALRLGEK